MSSLKGYIPGLARLLGTTPGALYERQRALVRAGMLDAGEGRGPGSGVRATDRAVALLLISVLATDRLTDSDMRARALANAKPYARRRCEFTRMPTFLQAFGAVLYGTGKAELVDKITVSRTAAYAEIRYRDPDREMHVTEFGDASEPGVSVSATLSHALLQQIAQDVQAMTFDEISGSET